MVDAAEAVPVDADEEFLVLPEAWPAVTLFLACQTQWRFAGMAGMRTGLDYPACELVANAQKKTLRRGELLAELQAIEGGAIKALAEAAERRAAKEKTA